MERKSAFRFRLPWSQSEPEPATRTTGSNRRTRQATRSRTASQPSSSTRPRTRPSSSPTTENSTPTTATSSSPAQPAAGTQGRNEVSASTTTPPPRSSQDSAETKTPSQSTTTSTSALPETLTTPPQASAESKAPIQSSTTNAPASTQLQEISSETSSKSDETSPSVSEKEPMPTTVWPQPEQVELLKKEAISDTLTEANHPSELSEVSSTRGITEEPSKISDYSRIINEPKTSTPLETNIPETKEVKEVVQETPDKNYGSGEKIGGFLTSKEQPDTVFLSKQANSDNDQIRVNRVSNGKQTRTTSAEQDIPLNKEVKDNISKFIHRIAIGDNKQNLKEGPVSVITLAGDNRGASMQLGSNSSKKGRAVHIHRGYKLNADESADATTDAEERQSNDARSMKDQELEAYMNCNVQGLNNSITLDSSIETKNPGIHMSLPRMPSETMRSSEGTVLVEAHKAEFNVTRAQKHTYEPTIRRRCLEGLFFEPSDSDSEKRDNNIDIL